MKQTVIQLENIHQSFKNNIIFQDLNLQIFKGNSLVIMGPGGCGKSLLLKIMALIIQPNRGQILYDSQRVSDLPDKSLRHLRHRIGMMFQNNALFDSLTIRENIGFYLDYHKIMPSDQILQKVINFLDKLNLKGIDQKKPFQLSGGMKKRVGLARALFSNPSFVFLDEPTAGLDPITANSISNMIQQIHLNYYPITLVSVSNDIACIMKIASHVAMIYHKQVYKHGTKEDILKSQDPVIRQFIDGKRKGPILY